MDLHVGEFGTHLLAPTRRRRLVRPTTGYREMMSFLRRNQVSPMATSVVVGVVTSIVALAVDGLLGPLVAIPTENARALLGATFAAVVTVGAFAFWMRPLAAQLATAAVPSRTVVRRLDDSFQHWTVSVTVGVLAYQAIIIFALPGSSGSSAPTIATALGGALGVMSIAGLFIAMQRAVRSTRPSVLVAESARAVMDQIDAAPRSTSASTERRSDETPAATILASSTGWVRAIDDDALTGGIDPGCTVRVEADVGSFVVAGWTTVASVWGQGGGRVGQEVSSLVASCFDVGDERGGTVDLTGSLTQFVDIGVHAATGGSAPSTVYETLWHLGAILHELCRHDLGVSDRTTDGGRAVIHRSSDAALLVDVAVDRFRQVAADQPALALTLVRVLQDVRAEAVVRGRGGIVDVVDDQCQLVVDQCRHAGALPHDVERVAVAASGETAGGDPSDRSEEYPAAGPPRDWAVAR